MIKRLDSLLLLLKIACVVIGQEHYREVRGVWIATVNNMDWPPSPDTPVDEQQSALIKLLDAAQAFGLNEIFFQVRPEADALYNSTIEPWSRYLTGTQGKAPSPFWDPLEFAVREAHARNMELHAWLNPYRAAFDNTQPLAPNSVASIYPQYAYDYGEYLWMDPGAKVVQDNTVNVILDIVSRYDVDGVHFDDYFYPYPISGVPFPDSATYNDYLAGGGTMNLSDWRRDNVNQLVQRIDKEVHDLRPDVKWGISPFGIWKPGYPPGVAGLSSYDELYADSRLWLEQGWVDYMAPQLYWTIESPNQSFPDLLQWWLNVSYVFQPVPRQVVAGMALYLHESNPTKWPMTQYRDQTDITRSFGAAGDILFSMTSILPQDVSDYYGAHIYTSPALPPEMPWVNSQQPPPPLGFTYDAASQTLKWQAPSVTANDPNAIRSFTLYRGDSQGDWQLWQVLNATTTVVSNAPAGKYALRSVNTGAVESTPVYA